MDLDKVEKYVTLYNHPTHTEVLYSGQPALSVSEGYDGGYRWNIVPVFARLVYGAELQSDIPFCTETFDSVETAVADGLGMLHSLGAFNEVDLDFSDKPVNESEEQIEELSKETLGSYVNKALPAAMGSAAKIGANRAWGINKDKEPVKAANKRVTGIKKATAKLVAERIYEELFEAAKLEADTAFEVHGVFNDYWDLAESVFDWRNNKKETTSYDLPGHVVMDVKSADNGETHVKRISSSGHVTTTRYGAGGNVVGKKVHDQEDPKPYFKKANIEMVKRSRGRPAKSGAEAGTSHDTVKAKLEGGHALSRYEKYIAQKHGLVAKGKAGRKGAPISDEQSEKEFKLLVNRSLKKAEKLKEEQSVTEGKDDKIAQLKKDHATAVHWSKNETSPQKREAARQKAEKIKRHLETQYKQSVTEGVLTESEYQTSLKKHGFKKQGSLSDGSTVFSHPMKGEVIVNKHNEWHHKPQHGGKSEDGFGGNTNDSLVKHLGRV